jgi:hypothetical protein
MSDSNDTSGKLNRLQQFAGDYFGVVYKTILLFWLMPEVPAGANVISSAFAIILLYLARRELTQPLDGGILAQIVVSVFLILLILCGISLIIDRSFRKRDEASEPPATADYRKLVSVVSTGITLGYAFIVLGYVLDWVGPVLYSASTAAHGYRDVAIVAAIFSSLILVLNTVGRFGWGIFLSVRAGAWAISICIFIAIGIYLSIGYAEPFFD